MAGETPIKVLNIVPSLAMDAGVTSFVRNMFLFRDSSRVSYDYLHHDVVNGELRHPLNYDDEFKGRGAKVFTVTHAGTDLSAFIREVKGFFQEHGSEYDVVHCHMPNSAFWTLRYAAEAGVAHRVLHSHLNSSSDRFSHRVRNAPLIWFGRRWATDGVACSEDAGRYLFRGKDFLVMRNGIDIDRFAFNPEVRTACRVELGIGPEEPVVGCVGRISLQKNFSFAVRAFGEYVVAHGPARLVIIGESNSADERRELQELVDEMGLENSVMLLGLRSDAYRLYSLFDVFFMPSLYEGLPVSAVEAQAAGLPCVYSTGVPAETDIAGTGSFTALDAPLANWARALNVAIEGGRHLEAPNKLEAAGYSAEANAARLMEYYERLLSR